MSEKDKLSFQEGDEEEFHITDEDIDRELAAMEVDHSAPTSNDTLADEMLEKPSAKQRFAVFKQLKRKHWIIIAIILIILLFGLLKIIGRNQSQSSFGQITPVPAPVLKTELATKKTSTADLTKTVFEPIAPPTTPAPAAPAPAAPAPAAPAPVASSLLPAPSLSAPIASGNPQLKTDLTTIASNETKLTQVLEVIQQQNQALAQQVSTLANRVGDLESTVTQSSQAIAGSSQAMATQQKNDAPPGQLPQLAQSVQAGPQYTVEAVVPQRAWLQAGDGSTITVMIGDEVPGLGAIVSIDPYSGNVTTASGTVIKYGS